MCGVVLLYLTLPIFIVIPMSFSSADYLQFPPPGFSLKWYRSLFGDYHWLLAAERSFKVAIITTILSTFLGILSSLSFIRGNFKGKNYINFLLLSPMIFPVIIIAIAIYGFYANLGIVGTVFGLVIAHTVMAFPFVFVTVSAALTNYNMEIEYASLSLGANRLKTFLKITLPIIRPGVMSGALFAFIISFDEVVVSMFISGWRYTLPVKMWMDVRTEINPTITAVSSLLICLSIVVLGTTTLLLKKK
jgi:putative spermidine/putrescine transport system permease protein